MGQPSLFGPLPPREPRAYAERCLDRATRPAAYWARFPDRLATDEQLRQHLAWVLGDWVGASGPGYHYITRSGLRFWAVQQGEFAYEAEQRKPDFQGTALLNAVRELRGIWRPT